MTNALLTPVQIARIALVRLSEKGVPPSPDNYRRFYNEVAGITEDNAPASESSQNAIATASMVVDDVTETTNSLLEALSGHNQGLQTSIEGLRAQSPGQSLVSLVNEILHTAVAMHQSVDASNGELRLMRDSLREIRQELAQNRPAPEHDTLTGARSRFALDGILRHSISRTRRYQGMLSIGIFDLDNFHHINDQFGAAIGDRLLAHIGEVTRASLRESDIFVRYGGEEFMIVMPETEAHGAQFVLDRLRLILQKTPLVYNGQRLFSTFSAGVAELCDEENHQELIERAYTTMQSAKTAGRNQVQISPRNQ